MRTTSARCISRSISETTQAALGKTSPHSTLRRRRAATAAYVELYISSVLGLTIPGGVRLQ